MRTKLSNSIKVMLALMLSMNVFSLNVIADEDDTAEEEVLQSNTDEENTDNIGDESSKNEEVVLDETGFNAESNASETENEETAFDNKINEDENEFEENSNSEQYDSDIQTDLMPESAYFNEGPETYSNFHIESGSNNVQIIVCDSEPYIDMTAGTSYYLMFFSTDNSFIGGGSVSLQKIENADNKMMIDPSSYSRHRNWTIKLEPGTYHLRMFSNGTSSKGYDLGNATYDIGFDCSVLEKPEGTTIKNVDETDASKGIIITCDKSDACSSYLEQLVNHEQFNNPDLNADEALQINFNSESASGGIHPWGGERNFEFFDKQYDSGQLVSLKLSERSITELNLPDGNYRITALCRSLNYEMPSGENVALYSNIPDVPEDTITVSFDENNYLNIVSTNKELLECLYGYDLFNTDGTKDGGVTSSSHYNVNEVDNKFYVSLQCNNGHYIKHGDSFYISLKLSGYKDAVLSDQLLTYPYKDVPNDLVLTAISDGLALFTEDTQYLNSFVNGLTASPYNTNVNIRDNTNYSGNVMPIQGNWVDTDIKKMNGKSYILCKVTKQDFDTYKMNTKRNWVLSHLDVFGYSTISDMGHSFSVSPVMIKSIANNIEGNSFSDLTELDAYTRKLTNVTLTENNVISEDVASNNIALTGALSGALLTNNEGGISTDDINSQSNDQISVTTSVSKTSNENVSNIVQNSGISDATRTDVAFDIAISKENTTQSKTTNITQLPYKAAVSFSLPNDSLADGERYALLSKHNNSYYAMPVTVSSDGNIGTAYTDKFSSFVLVKTKTSFSSILRLIMKSYDLNGAEVGLYLPSVSRSDIRGDMRTSKEKALKIWTSGQGTVDEGNMYDSSLEAEDIDAGNYIVAVRKNGYISTMIEIEISDDEKDTEITMRELGDVDGANRVDVADLSLASSYILASTGVNDESTDAADYNQDGVIDVADLSLMSSRILRGA